jgi:hypothetical protein
MEQAFKTDPKGLPQLCASSDKGGGVGVGDAFAIYSVVASPLDSGRAALKAGLLAELTSAASAVRSVIPVITTERPCQLDVVSLPCPAPPTSDPTRGIPSHCSLPWFLINASRFAKHKIIGQGDTTESLLMVLQRPWCVLEICCCDSSAVSAIYQFAIVAAKLNLGVYSHAVELLYHELSIRTVRSLAHTKYSKFSSAKFCISYAELGTTWIHVRKVYVDLSSSRVRSHNSFWLRLISTCTIYLGIGCSHMVRILFDIASGDMQLHGQNDSSNAMYHACTKRKALGPRPLVQLPPTGEPVHSKRRSTWALGDRGMHQASYDSSNTSSDLHHLRLIYRYILMMISESVP